jgi:hypothetical protein
MLKKPRRAKGIVRKSLGKEELLYNPQTKSVHVLNKTSSLIWDLCDGDNDLKVIEKEMASRFDVSKESDLRKDLEETLDKFKELGLIEF